MQEEKVAEGTPTEWSAYTPDGCGMFFVDKELALEWERLSSIRDRKIREFYRSPEMQRLNNRSAEIMELNSKQIKVLSEEIRRRNQIG